MKAISISVLGKVQGVAFRYYTKTKADELGLTGTVQNLEDGSVLIHTIGDQRNLDSIIKWCHIGSPASKVEQVIIKELTDQNIESRLDINLPKSNERKFVILRH